MFNWIKRWLKKPEAKKDWTADQVVHPDPLFREMVARCMNTGSVVIGNRNEDGSTEIREVK